MIGRSTLAGLAAWLLAPFACALELQLVPDGLSVLQQQQAQALMADTLALLPPAWQADPRRLPLQFDQGLGAEVAGHQWRGRIRLQPALLERPRAMPGSGHDLARASLIHEIAHAFDRQGGGWSSDPQFRRLAGWDRMGSGNPYTLRSPDDYERHSPAESFAVNLEWYLLDPQYACRRPALAAWYGQQFGPAPHALPCAQALPWLAATGRNGGVAIEWIDPARVHAVDYLLADSGGPPMSRFGHSMLRLVICAPGREPGPRCRMDLAHHRVLSFRAFVQDVQVSSWAGLTGGYPSRLFVLPLDQVIDEYTRVELRDLQAWPLALSAGQIRQLLHTAAGVHWNYDGDYTFIGNNCAVETGRLLDTALNPAAGRHYRRTFPRGVLRRLVSDGLAEDAAPGPADTASGLYFPSARAEYSALHALLRDAGQVPAMTMERWLDAPAAVRGALPADPTLEQAAAWLVLEQAALRRAQLRAVERLKPQLRQSPALGDAVAGWLGWLGRIDAPGQLPLAGYGLPQADELAAAAPALQALSDQGPQQWQQLQDAAEAALDADARAGLAVGRQRVRQVGVLLRQRLD